MPRNADVLPAQGGSLAHLRNNTADWWFKDAGMRKLALGIFVGYLGIINGGYDSSLFSGLQANPLFLNAIDNPDSNKLGIISAAMSLGGIPAVPAAAFIADRFGRKAGVACGAIFVIIGALVQTFTTGGWKMLGGRFVLGFGAGFQTVMSATFVTEIAHPRNRAQATALVTTFYYVGAIVAAWTTFGALNVSGEWSWRFCCFLQIGPAIFILSLLYFAPESPRYMIAKGDEEKALQMLSRYHANGDANDELVQFEFQEIKEAIAADRTAAAEGSYLDFFKTKGNRHRLVILLCTAFFSQWAGNGIISYYITSVLNLIGVTSSTQQTAYNGGLQIFNWLFSIAGGLMCERMGRRFMWLFGATGMLFTYAVVAGCSAAYAHTGSASAGKAVLAFIYLYFGFYDVAFTPLSNAYALEILPYNLRARGMAIWAFCVYCAGFFNQYVNPIALDALKWKYYLVYLAIIALAIVCIYFLYPETKGLLLEEIGEIFDGPSAVLPVQHSIEDSTVTHGATSDKLDAELAHNESHV